MKIRLCSFLLILCFANVANSIPVATGPCKPFRVVDIVERMIFDTFSPKSRSVLFFDLRFLSDHHMNFDPPSPRYYDILRKGNKVIVKGRKCGDEYYVDTVRRVR